MGFAAAAAAAVVVIEGLNCQGNTCQKDEKRLFDRISSPSESGRLLIFGSAYKLLPLCEMTWAPKILN